MQLLVVRVNSYSIESSLVFYMAYSHRVRGRSRCHQSLPYSLLNIFSQFFHSQYMISSLKTEFFPVFLAKLIKGFLLDFFIHKFFIDVPFFKDFMPGLLLRFMPEFLYSWFPVLSRISSEIPSRLLYEVFPRVLHWFLYEFLRVSFRYMFWHAIRDSFRISLTDPLRNPLAISPGIISAIFPGFLRWFLLEFLSMILPGITLGILPGFPRHYFMYSSRDSSRDSYWDHSWIFWGFHLKFLVWFINNSFLLGSNPDISSGFHQSFFL